ncbi:hypothetical protein [Hoylesella timonensis]|uniref:DUF2479 domain-containing protein n=1 Tax=Hoylesella timonensis TaxID=386414 RepID=A0A2N6Q725_9BACT|nr:hypothetical protein [Hoylesella timonensis]PMC10732.1 hypothetical protein CJ232_04330 [Hoylesella timonensis]
MNNEMCGCGTEEKTNTAKGIVRINYKEDFELVVELLAGDKPYQLGDEDFRIDFIVMASRYTVGRTGSVCERCSVDGNKIRCFMDGHGLPPGELRAEVKVNTPDPNYADGKRLNVAIAEGTVVLVKDNTRFDGAVVKANIPVALVDAYQLAKAHGYKGTIDEYYATFSDVSALLESMRGVAEEERERSTSEEARNKAEQQRQDNEDTRQRADKDRTTAESYRASSEKERAKAEKQRNDTEVSRNKNEQQRQTDEDARQKAETERQTAEKERATAEGKRETDTKDAIERVNERMKTLRDGTDGKSAYDIWKAQGNSGTEADFVSSLGNAMKIVTHEETETTVTLRPFEEHRWKGKPKTLDITMEKPQQGELAAEYRMCFNTPDDAATTVALPNNVQFTVEPAFRFGCYYELSLVSNDNEYKGLFAEWRRKL